MAILMRICEEIGQKLDVNGSFTDGHGLNDVLYAEVDGSFTENNASDECDSVCKSLMFIFLNHWAPHL